MCNISDSILSTLINIQFFHFSIFSYLFSRLRKHALLDFSRPLFQAFQSIEAFSYKDQTSRMKDPKMREFVDFVYTGCTLTNWHYFRTIINTPSMIALK